MKKTFLMALMALFTSVASFAQQSVGSLTIQPKIGLNVANVSDGDGSDNRIGLALGAEFEYRLTPVFSLSAGALYSMQGCKGVVEVDEGNSGEVTATRLYQHSHPRQRLRGKGPCRKARHTAWLQRQAQGYGYGKRRERYHQPPRHQERRLQHPHRRILRVQPLCDRRSLQLWTYKANR